MGIAEEICEEGETDESDQEEKEPDADRWTWFRKELHKAWSVLDEARCGRFGPSNTVHLDELPDLSSHPENVIQVAEWSDGEDGSTMATMQEYIRGLVSNSSTSVVEYLKTHPLGTHRSSVFDQWTLAKKRQQDCKRAAPEPSTVRE